jgi:hypothetical protein
LGAGVGVVLYSCTIVGRSREREENARQSCGDHSEIDGGKYDETWGDEPFDEEGFDPEEAERRITQFVTSTDELPGPLSRSSRSGSQR